mgnify:CR=1 FL=1
MEEKMSGGKRFGYLCLAAVPLILYSAIMVIVTMALMILKAVEGILEGEADIYTYLMEGVMDSTMLAGVIYAVVGIICLGLWYYFGCKRKNLKPSEAALSPVNLLLLVFLAFAMQYVINYLMAGIDVLMPDALEAYVEMMEQAGIGEILVAGILYVVILGPIAEELCFRGVTLFYAQKGAGRFWIANIIQAAAFGIMHMNLVQGLYAFVLGLILGWVYHRCHSLYASIWLHMFFNALSFGILEAFNRLLPEHMVFQVFWMVFTCILAVGMILLLTKRTAEHNYEV